MHIVTKQAPYQVTDQPPQAPLVILATGEALLAVKSQIPRIDRFELVLVGSGRSQGMPLGHEISALFVNAATRQSVAAWYMYDFDVTGPQTHLPLPSTVDSVRTLDEDTAFVAAADDDFVYIASGDNGIVSPTTFTRYAKIPRIAYETEWRLFVDWYVQAT